MSKHPKIPGCLEVYNVQCTSKRPETSGRLGVRLNLLVFQDVFTYFQVCDVTCKHPGILGCLDIHLNIPGHVDKY